MTKDKKRIHIWVSGRVQGVYYRQTCLAEASRLEIKGWVKNLLDGRVEAIFEGDCGSVEKITEWCKKGPSFARVSHVEIVEETYTGEFNSFNVKHT